MDQADVTRSIVFFAYLSVGLFAFAKAKTTVHSQRRLAVLLIGMIGLIWAAFYAWITPTFWGTYESVDSVRSLAGMVSRFAHLPNAITLALLLVVIRRAEATELASVKQATEQLRQAIYGLGDD